MWSNCLIIRAKRAQMGSPTLGRQCSDSAAWLHGHIGLPRRSFLCCWAALKVKMPVKGPHGFSWVQPAVYPLYAAVGVGVLAACTIITRKLTAVSQAGATEELEADCEVLTHTTCQFHAVVPAALCCKYRSYSILMAFSIHMHSSR